MCEQNSGNIFMGFPQKTKENFSEMNKYKQNLYTILLIFTCFVASPFIFHKIWKTSSDAKKTVNVPPPSVSDTIKEGNESTGGDSSGAEPSASDSTGDAQQAQTPTQAPEAVFTFGASDISYFDDALFIGDSRTVGIQEYGTFTNSDFFCSIGMMASNIDSQNINGQTFDQLIDSKQYGKVYVMLGINEVGNDFQFTLTKYRAIIEKLKAHQTNATIYIQANLHITTSRSSTDRIYNNTKLNDLNARIKAMCDGVKIVYMDVNPIFDDATGGLSWDYAYDDFHLKSKYYDVWVDWILKNS
jgi:hypothetical protein